MSLFETLKNAIFHSSSSATTSPSATGGKAGAPPPAPAQPGNTASSGSPGATAAAQTVDVQAVLDGLNAKQKPPLNWQTSIVDLMKLVGLDSSLQHRQQLAKELGYTGDPNDSAPMNIWLHKAVMRKLADNGGKVPATLVG